MSDCADIFKCTNKLQKHSKQYERHHSDPSSASMIRMAMLKLCSAINPVTQMEVKTSDEKIDEKYKLTGDKVSIDVTLQCTAPSSKFEHTVINADTFLRLNKHVNVIGSYIGCEKTTDAVKSFITELTSLCNKGFMFICDFDGDYFDLRLISNKYKTMVDFVMVINH